MKKLIRILLSAENKAKYIRIENYVNTGKSKIDAFKTVIIWGGAFVLLTNDIKLSGEIAVVGGVLLAVLYYTLSFLVGRFWFRSGWAAETVRFNNEYDDMLKGIMENTKK